MSPKCKTLSSSEEFPDYGGTIKFANHLIHKGVMVSAIPNSREGGVLICTYTLFQYIHLHGFIIRYAYMVSSFHACNILRLIVRIETVIGMAEMEDWDSNRNFFLTMANWKPLVTNLPPEYANSYHNNRQE